MAAENPFAFGQLLNVVYIFVKKPVEVTIVSGSSDARDVINWLNGQFIPEGIFAVVNAERIEQMKDLAFFKGKEAVKDKGFTAYVCKDFACSLPLHSVDEIKSNLNH
jgi:hypothetical protein